MQKADLVRTVSFALALASGLLGVAVALFLALQPRGLLPPARAPANAGLEEVLVRLDDRMSEVLARLERMEAAQLSPGSAPMTRPAASLSPIESMAADKPQQGPGPRLIPGGTEATHLRGLVRQVIEEEREERQAEEAREWKELGQGPYGEFNLRVNYLAARLGFNDLQRQRYFDLLSHYSERLQEAGKNLNKLDPESIRVYQETAKEVQDEFDRMMVQGLNASQAREYQGLPPAARSAGPEGHKAVASLASGHPQK